MTLERLAALLAYLCYYFEAPGFFLGLQATIPAGQASWFRPEAPFDVVLTYLLPALYLQ